MSIPMLRSGAMPHRPPILQNVRPCIMLPHCFHVHIQLDQYAATAASSSSLTLIDPATCQLMLILQSAEVPQQVVPGFHFSMQARPG